MARLLLKRIVVLATILYGIVLSVYSQADINAIQASSNQLVEEALPTSNIQPLHIGDKVPDITFRNVLNYKTKTARLSDFKGKLVILDMWSTTCTSCIAAFPKMEKLQKEFGDKLQILLVNPHISKYDTEGRINDVLGKQKKRTGFYPALPIPIHDDILNSYFPHQSVPHQVWIDGEGNIIAITGSQDVTVENIQAALSGNKFSMPVKDDWAFNRELPLLVNGNGGASNDFVFRSVFTKYLGGIGFSSGIRRNENKEVTGFYMLNNSLRHFIASAYSDIMNGISNARIILDVKNPVQYKREFNPTYTYCYDLTIPPTPSKELKLNYYLKEDLKRFFNIRVYKEKRKVKSLTVIMPGKFGNNVSKYEKQQLDLDKASIKKYFHNYPVSEILKILESYLDQPLVDETHIEKRIDLDFPEHFDLSNKTNLINYLSQKGFVMKEEERELDVIIITDK